MSSRGLTLAEARGVCREAFCPECGANTGQDCVVSEDGPRKGLRMRNGELTTFHEARWKNTKGYPFTIIDV